MAAKRPGRKPSNPDERTYAGRTAARLRELRLSRGWDIDEMYRRLQKQGWALQQKSYYDWESGRVSVSVDAIPAIAKVFGYSTAGGWLPKQ